MAAVAFFISRKVRNNVQWLHIAGKWIIQTLHNVQWQYRHFWHGWYLYISSQIYYLGRSPFWRWTYWFEREVKSIEDAPVGLPHIHGGNVDTRNVAPRDSTWICCLNNKQGKWPLLTTTEFPNGDDVPADVESQGNIRCLAKLPYGVVTIEKDIDELRLRAVVRIRERQI